MRDLSVGVIYCCVLLLVIDIVCLFFKDLPWKHIVESAVTSGTLDAIRERMKSMQLAAAGGNMDDYGTRPLMSVNDNLNLGLSTQTRTLDAHLGMENPAQGGVLPMDEKALSGLQARMERLKSGGALEPL